jgi:hypothetical protein
MSFPLVHRHRVTQVATLLALTICAFNALADSASSSFWKGVGGEVANQVFEALKQLEPPSAAQPGNRSNRAVRPTTPDEYKCLFAKGIAAWSHMAVIDLNSDVQDVFAQKQKWLSTGEQLAHRAPDAETKNMIYNSIAWHLATHPNDKFRDGAEALRFASMALQETDWKDPVYRDTYAAALAESGDFDGAVRNQEISLASTDLEARIGAEEVEAAQERLQLYKDHKPARESDDEVLERELMAVFAVMAAAGAPDCYADQ